MPISLSLPRNRRLMLPADNQADDGSICSTLTVERPNAKLSTFETVRTAKRVSFNPVETVVHAKYSIGEDDMGSLWFNKQDYATFKAYTTAIGKKLSRTETRANSHSSYSGVLARTYQACTKAGTEGQFMTEAERSQLERWLGMTTCRVGAERAIVKQLRKEMRRTKKEYIATVLELQGTATGAGSGSDEATMIIRTKCEQISRPGRLFAQTMAAAYVTAGAEISAY